MITLTAEQAQQIEEVLADIVRVYKFDTGTPVKALATIRAAKAQEQAEQEPVTTIRIDRYGEAHIDAYVDLPTGEHDVYAAPVRTKDLTDDEIAKAVGSPLDEVYLADFRSVIAAYREKNRA